MGWRGIISKCASVQRSFKSECLRIKSSNARCQLALLQQQKMNCPVCEWDELDKQMDVHQKVITAYENHCKRALSPTFPQELENVYNQFKDKGGNSKSVYFLQCELQADPTIGCLVQQFPYSLILSNDADYMVLTGKHCLMIKDFMFDYGYRNKPVVTVMSG